MLPSRKGHPALSARRTQLAAEDSEVEWAGGGNASAGSAPGRGGLVQGTTRGPHAGVSYKKVGKRLEVPA